MQKLTPRQAEILSFIKRCLEDHGFPPTRAEIAQELGFKSPNAAEEHLKALARKGAIEMTPGASRGIRIPGFEPHAANDDEGLPVIGRVAAGAPILAEQNIESYFPVPAEYVPRGESFVLKVHGTSMINAGIMDGDYIFVNSCRNAENGEIIVALIDDSATVKRFYKEDGHIRLQPENDEMEPIIVEDCQILGKVFGVYRVMK